MQTIFAIQMIAGNQLLYICCRGNRCVHNGIAIGLARLWIRTDSVDMVVIYTLRGPFSQGLIQQGDRRHQEQHITLTELIL